MRAAIISKDRQLVAIEDAPEPVLQDGHVLLKVAFCGICGSDLGSIKNADRFAEGYIMGHEVAGEVIESAADVPEWQSGDRVAVYHAPGCGECAMCTAGRSYRCLKAHDTSIGHGVVPGGYAERIAVPKSLLYRLPAQVDLRLGALAEPLGIAVHGINMSQMEPSWRVCILGAGPIGSLTARALELRGYQSVVVVDPNSYRVKRLIELGIRAVTLDDVESKVAAELGGAPDVVFECSGNKDAAGLAIELVAPFGKVILQGRPMAPSPISQGMAGRKELHIIGTMSCTQAEFQVAVDELGSRGDSYAGLVGAVYPLDRAQAAFEQLRLPENDHVKVLIGGGTDS
jgi:(R,R)-butanediol dehydrogenase/meso-butanediol dehydrogenase/diacetyl reductase